MQRRLALMTILALIVASAIVPYATGMRAAGTPTLTVTPSTGIVGASLAVSGVNFTPSSTVTLRWDAADGTVLGTTITSASGAFSAVTVTIPGSAATGIHALFAADGTLSATSMVTVLPLAGLTLDPSSALAGTAVSAAGAGFTPDAVVTLRWETVSGTVLATPSADSSGAFTGASIIVPLAASVGTHMVFAGDGTFTASTTLRVVAATATLSVAPTSQVAGGTVIASGTGYGANESVMLHWDGSAGPVLTTIVASAAGDFSGATVIVPATAAVGAHALVGVGGTTSRQASASLTVTSSSGAGDEHQGGTRPGWGCGDTNHEHSGPAGHGNAESPCDKAKEHDADNDHEGHEANKIGRSANHESHGSASANSSDRGTSGKHGKSGDGNGKSNAEKGHRNGHD